MFLASMLLNRVQAGFAFNHAEIGENDPGNCPTQLQSAATTWNRNLGYYVGGISTVNNPPGVSCLAQFQPFVARYTSSSNTATTASSTQSWRITYDGILYDRVSAISVAPEA